jgi:hypothetical protein
MALWSNVDEEVGKPKNLSATEKAATLGVDAVEAGETDGITHAGWVLKNEGTGGRAGRVSYETLVAMGSMTSDSDSLPPLPVITIDTQPTAQSETEGSNATFTVVATASATSTLSFQWQKAEAEANTTFANISGATSAVYETPALTNADDDGDFYRVVVSGTNGAVSVTSDAVELTVTL